MGKGTAIKRKSDIDLVLVLNDVEDAKDLKRKIREIKDKIKEKLTSESKNFTIVHKPEWETPFAVQFTVVSPYGNIDVDLLPTFHFQGINTYQFDDMLIFAIKIGSYC